MKLVKDNVFIDLKDEKSIAKFKAMGYEEVDIDDAKHRRAKPKASGRSKE